MPTIEGFRIENYRILKDVTLGKLWHTQDARPLTSLTAVIGDNGVGKSTIFDALGFLADAFQYGVEEACDMRGRGGFQRLRTQGQTEPIRFEIYYRQHRTSRPITYQLSIDEDQGRPFVCGEHLRQRRKGQKRGHPFSFLRLKNGRGLVWKGEETVTQLDNDEVDLFGERVAVTASGESSAREAVQLADPGHPGIATLDSLRQHPRFAAFRSFIEDRHLSYLTPDAAREWPLTGPEERLNRSGDNLGNVVQFLQQQHPEHWQRIVQRIARKIPEIDRVDTESTDDGRLLLRFNRQGSEEAFHAGQMSAGTMKVFAYLLLLEDPSPAPLLCIEEPENGLYHKLLDILAREFRAHAAGRRGESQVFITTHQPYLVDALEPEQVWILKRERAAGRAGFTVARRADDELAANGPVAEELSLGGRWYSGYLDGRGAAV